MTNTVVETTHEFFWVFSFFRVGFPLHLLIECPCHIYMMSGVFFDLLSNR
jgi:hypothetical protein